MTNDFIQYLTIIIYLFTDFSHFLFRLGARKWNRENFGFTRFVLFEAGAFFIVISFSG